MANVKWSGRVSLLNDLNGVKRLNGLNVLNQHWLADQPEVERRVKMRDLTVTGTTCDTPMGLPMSM
jgi:hypothetical protein